jgi:hypothetical protein
VARRFALALVAILALLLGAFLVMRSLRAPKAGAPPVLAPRPTAVVPPTPIPARNVTLFFESTEGDGALHPEARDVPVATDDVAFLRALASGVVEGPRSADLVRPFPEGWTLRGAYLLRDGVAVLDVAPPRVPAPPEAAGPAAPEHAVPAPPATVKWQAGAHEEDTAVQALAVTVCKNMTGVTRVVLLVAGEPADTLAGHVDLTHPIAPDFTRAAAETPRPAQAPPTATPTPAPTETPTAEPTKAPTRAPKQTKPPARPKGETT